MSSPHRTIGTVFLAQQATGAVHVVEVPDHDAIRAVEPIMRADFEAAEAAGGSSVRLGLTELLDEAISAPEPGLEHAGVMAAAALGLLRLYGTPGLAILDQGEGYIYAPIFDAKGVNDAKAGLSSRGVRKARPATRRRMH